MKCFRNNRCRLCSKTFCCPKCRALHEEKTHQVNPECEICIYGRATVKNASVSLLNHIRTNHWPLHCVFCKKVFSSLDDLIPHDKCPLQMKTLKMQGTSNSPVTPVTENEKPSLEVTPFYKAIKLQIQPNNAIVSMRATSTPLVHKQESEQNDKITPLSQSDIICQKSSLKLTGSSILSDSKKSERRVTFSETPSVSEFCKKPKYLTTPKLVRTNEEKDLNNSSHGSYSNVTDEEDIFKSAKSGPCDTPSNEEKENINTDLIFHDSDSNDAQWESALTKLDFSSDNVIENIDNKMNEEKIDNKTNQFNVALQINVFNNTVTTDENSSSKSKPDISLTDTPTDLWSSVTNIVKSVVNNISVTAQNSFCVGTKRSKPDNDVAPEPPCLKRIKLTDIKCRPPIREISPLYHIRLRRPHYVDKATQTDESWI